MKKRLNTSLIIITITFVGSLFFSSCSKESNGSATTSFPLITTSMSYDENDVLKGMTIYQYDKDKKLTKRTYKDGSYDLIEYSGSTVTSKRYSNEKLDYTAFLELNNKGLCTSESYDDDYSLVTYEYDSNGYLKSYISESDSWVYTETYTVSGGNYVTFISVDKSKTTKSASIKGDDFYKRSALYTNLRERFTPKTRLKSAATDYIYKIDYQFYTNKTNTIGQENWGISYLGKQNKNPIMQETGTSTYGSDTNSYISTYTYEYDNKGRITKQIADDGYYTVFTYAN